MSSPPSATPVYRVLYFGDSLTAGSAMPPDQQLFVWPNLVEQVSAGKFLAINEGLGGRPTDSIPDFEKALQKHAGAFDLLVIALGGNDARDISGNCVPNAVKNLRAMVELVRLARLARPVRILIAGPANIRKDTLGPTKPIANERDQNLRDLDAAYARLAPELSCQFVSLYGTIPAASLAMDGVHPDAEGNQPIAAAMLEALNKLAVPH